MYSRLLRLSRGSRYVTRMDADNCYNVSCFWTLIFLLFSDFFFQSSPLHTRADRPTYETIVSSIPYTIADVVIFRVFGRAKMCFCAVLLPCSLAKKRLLVFDLRSPNCIGPLLCPGAYDLAFASLSHPPSLTIGRI